jgi:Fe-S-cluster-containing dehydrogenase component
MAVDRRSLLKGMAAAGTVAAVAPVAAQAKERPEAPPDAMGMLYDATLCIGCKTCVVACRKANNLDYESYSTLWDNPVDLSARTKNIIKLYHEGDKSSYMKAQCMHCLDPGCVGACMMGSFQKREHGIVTWKGDRCIGCRYCAVACPYEVPKFEWDKALPKVVKCEMCSHLVAKGQIPACCDVCPRHAVIYGPYPELLSEAKKRLADKPDRYYPKVFGEHDGGGTQVLYLSAAGIPFTSLGLPDLGDESVPNLVREVQHGIYKGFIAPAALYVVLGAVMLRNRKQSGKEGHHE